MIQKKRLAIFDIGNSRIKAHVTELIINGNASEQSDASNIRRADIDYAIDYAEAAVIGASGDASELQNRLKTAGIEDILLVNHDTPLPIVIRYADGILGVDRAAAACGVNHPALIADAGTALTLDLTAYDDSHHLTFLGGNISAGLQLRLDALHNATHLLPLIKISDAPENFVFSELADGSFIGDDTRSAMLLGALGGMAAETIAIAYAARACYGINEIIFTGGDASLLHKAVAIQLKHQPNGNFRLHIEPHIIAEGLRNIYHYNSRLK